MDSSTFSHDEPILQGVIDKPSEYTQEFYRVMFQRLERRITIMEDETSELKRLFKLAIDHLNAVGKNRREDAAEIGRLQHEQAATATAMDKLRSESEAITKRLDAASEYMRSITQPAKKSA